LEFMCLKPPPTMAQALHRGVRHIFGGHILHTRIQADRWRRQWGPRDGSVAARRVHAGGRHLRGAARRRHCPPRRRPPGDRPRGRLPAQAPPSPPQHREPRPRARAALKFGQFVADLCSAVCCAVVVSIALLNVYVANPLGKKHNTFLTSLNADPGRVRF